MPRTAQQLRRDALAIWHAGLEAVRPQRLMREHCRVDGRTLRIGREAVELDDCRRIAVVGAGKAGAAMAAAVLDLLGLDLVQEKQLTGWINVPADSAGSCGGRIHLHAARPPGVNEPTPEGVSGTEQILKIVKSLTPDDLCLCLISGGGSALLPAPADPMTLADKLAVTRHLSASGANIEELNAVRKQLSRIKGGGLARACRAGRLMALVISDVLGDPLDVIASGPTVPDTSTPAEALAVLEKFQARQAGIRSEVFDYLRLKSPTTAAATCHVMNVVIGNNATAVEAAGREAERLGYRPKTVSAARSEGAAEQVGIALAEEALAMRAGSGPDCLVSGGEPTVKLIAAPERGKGGRNQQLVLAALKEMEWELGDATGIVLVSGGTDGEDGPTDAAGALVDAEIIAAAKRQGLDAADYLGRNDAYHFFEPLAGLIKTGPTHTNVCDLRVVVVNPTTSVRPAAT